MDGEFASASFWGVDSHRSPTGYLWLNRDSFACMSGFTCKLKNIHYADEGGCPSAEMVASTDTSLSGPFSRYSLPCVPFVGPASSDDVGGLGPGQLDDVGRVMIYGSCRVVSTCGAAPPDFYMSLFLSW